MKRDDYDSDYQWQENVLLADNLARIDRLSRRGLLRFLDLERSKRNTKRLRKRARFIALKASSVNVAVTIARAEDSL